MRKIILVAVVILTLCGCSGKNVVVKENTIKYDVTKEQITLTYTLLSVEKQLLKDGTCTIIANGMNNTYDNISLPFVSYVLALPIDTNIDTVIVSNKGELRSMKDVEISSQDLAPIGLDAGNSNKEESCKSVVFVQSSQGVKIAYITLYPLIYNEDLKTLTWLENGEVTISLKEEKWDLSHLENLDRIKNSIDNPEMLEEYSLYLNNY